MEQEALDDAPELGTLAVLLLQQAAQHSVELRLQRALEADLVQAVVLLEGQREHSVEVALLLVVALQRGLEEADERPVDVGAGRLQLLRPVEEVVEVGRVRWQVQRAAPQAPVADEQLMLEVQLDALQVLRPQELGAGEVGAVPVELLVDFVEELVEEEVDEQVPDPDALADFLRRTRVEVAEDVAERLRADGVQQSDEVAEALGTHDAVQQQVVEGRDQLLEGLRTREAPHEELLRKRLQLQHAEEDAREAVAAVLVKPSDVLEQQLEPAGAQTQHDLLHNSSYLNAVAQRAGRGHCGEDSENERGGFCTLSVLCEHLRLLHEAGELSREVLDRVVVEGQVEGEEASQQLLVVRVVAQHRLLAVEQLLVEDRHGVDALLLHQTHLDQVQHFQQQDLPVSVFLRFEQCKDRVEVVELIEVNEVAEVVF